MPRKGPAIPISDAWKKRVIDRIAEMGISQNALARKAKISKSALSEALSEESKQTTIMAEIHEALGWDPPPTMTKDSLELMAIVEQLPERDQGELLGQARERLRRLKSRARD